MIFPQLDALALNLSALETQGLRRARRTVESVSQGYMVVDGSRLLTFNSNDYLGLASHPQVVEALKEGASWYGAGSGASHLVSGHSQAHDRLEELLAMFLWPHLPSVRALYFSTGYMANLGVLTALAGTSSGDISFFSDQLNHASLIDGIRLTREPFHIYPHADIADLSLKLSSCQSGTKVVVTDGVFSMDGDIAPVAALAKLAQAESAWFVVDDAHGLGVVGAEGRGVCEQQHLDQKAVPILIGTFGKALGTFGAFVAGESALIEWLIQSARTYIYTTALPPPIAAATRRALQLVDQERWRREKLHELIQLFRDGAQRRGIVVMPSMTAIQPVVCGSSAMALQASAYLRDHGFHVAAIRPPTVPEGSARLRITLNAHHQADEVERLLAALEGAISHALKTETST